MPEHYRCPRVHVAARRLVSFYSAARAYHGLVFLPGYDRNSAENHDDSKNVHHDEMAVLFPASQRKPNCVHTENKSHQSGRDAFPGCIHNDSHVANEHEQTADAKPREEKHNFLETSRVATLTGL